MNSKKIIAIFAMLAVIATTVVFIGCEKKENPVIEQRKDALKRQKLAVTLHVWQKVPGYKKRGMFKNSHCEANTDKNCNLFWKFDLHDEAKVSLDIVFEAKITKYDRSTTAILSNPEPENTGFPKRILAEFPNEWNDYGYMDEFFTNGHTSFVVDEDIIEGGESSLLEMLGTEDPCIIRAGEYPVYMNDEGNYVVEFMVEQFFFEVGTNPALRLQIGDQHHYSGYSEFSELYELYGYSNVIYAECLRELNNNPEAITMMEHFISTNKFVVTQDIVVDDDSYLLEMLGVDFPCVIRAGEYPIYTADGDDFVIAFAVEPL